MTGYQMRRDVVAFRCGDAIEYTGSMFMTSDASVLRKQVSVIESVVEAAANQSAVILRVTDSKGAPIENGGDTDDSTIKLIGYSDPGHSVVIRDHYSLVTQVMSDANGAWSAGVKNLRPEVHEFRAIAGDHVSSPWVVEVVESGPDVQINSVKDRQDNSVPPGSITSETILVIAGSVGVAGAELEVLDGFRNLGWVVPAADGSWRFDTLALSLGHHVFRVLPPQGEPSGPWEVKVIEAQGTIIERVTENDQDGPEVADGEITYATTLSFVGSATPDQALYVYDGPNLSDLVYEGRVGPDGHWIAVAENLEPRLYEFIVKTAYGKSSTWRVTVKDLVSKSR
jgi:hypothetical protein